MEKFMRFFRFFGLATLLVFLILALALVVPLGVRANDGDPNWAGEGRLRALEARVAAIESALGIGSQPVELAVNCPEESVRDALEEVADHRAPVTITITGVCTEDIEIYRDDVTLRGAAPGDGLQPALPGDPVLDLRGHRIRLEQLTLMSGDDKGIHATDDAVFSATDLRVLGADIGVYVERNASGDLFNVSIENTHRGLVASNGGVLRMYGGAIDTCASHAVEASYGAHIGLKEGVVVRNSGSLAVHAREGGSIEVSGGTIKDNNRGAAASTGGHLTLEDETVVQNNAESGVGAHPGGTVWLMEGVLVANNSEGGIWGSGGAFNISDTIIENNDSDGISLGGGSTASIFSGTIVRNNAGHGIALSALSVATFEGSVEVIGNTGTAVICGTSGLDDLAMIVGEPGIISGNGSDTVECP